MNIFLFLSFAFLFTFLVGRLIEKIKVPWIFAALILGSLLAVSNAFSPVTSSPAFVFLAQLGMYFLLFIIGFEINLKQIRKKGAFILKGTFFIIFLEAFFGSLIVRFVFGYDWVISFLVALSFATVGEAVLIPILDEFKIVNTRLGQTIIGIGTLDDLIEITALILVAVLVGSGAHTHFNISLILVSLLVLFLLTIGFTKLRQEGRKFSFSDIETLFLFTVFIFFLFLGIGEYAESAPLAALLAGVSIRTFIPEKRLKLIESEVKSICYGLFAPVFFLWAGASMNANYILHSPFLVFLIVTASAGAKLLGSYIFARKELGVKKSVLLGIGLSVRFSTSIVIIKILLDAGLIAAELYSVMIASTIAFMFVVPVLFSSLLATWGMKNER